MLDAVDEEGRRSLDAELLRPALGHLDDAAENALVAEAGLELSLIEALALQQLEERRAGVVDEGPAFLLTEEQVDDREELVARSRRATRRGEGCGRKRVEGIFAEDEIDLAGVDVFLLQRV